MRDGLLGVEASSELPYAGVAAIGSRGCLGFAASKCAGSHASGSDGDVDAFSVHSANTQGGPSARTQRRAAQRKTSKVKGNPGSSSDVVKACGNHGPANDRMSIGLSQEAAGQTQAVDIQMHMQDIKEVLANLSAKMDKLEEKCTSKTQAYIEQLTARLDAHEGAISKLRRQRDRARLDALIVRGQIMSQRRAQGLDSDPENSDRVSPEDQSENYSEDSEEEIGEDEDLEDEEEEESIATAVNDLEGDDETLDIQHFSAQDGHLGFTFLQNSDATSLRAASRAHARIVLESVWQTNM